jgi:hypothetical protein
MCNGICFIRRCTCGKIIEQCACDHGKPKRETLHTGARGCVDCIAAFYKVYPQYDKDALKPDDPSNNPVFDWVCEYCGALLTQRDEKCPCLADPYDLSD